MRHDFSKSGGFKQTDEVDPFPVRASRLIHAALMTLRSARGETGRSTPQIEGNNGRLHPLPPACDVGARQFSMQLDSHEVYLT